MNKWHTEQARDRVRYEIWICKSFGLLRFIIHVLTLIFVDEHQHMTQLMNFDDKNDEIWDCSNNRVFIQYDVVF